MVVSRELGADMVQYLLRRRRVMNAWQAICAILFISWRVEVKHGHPCASQKGRRCSQDWRAARGRLPAAW